MEGCGPAIHPARLLVDTKPLRRAALGVFVVLLAAVAVALAARRLDGALREPLSAMPLLCIAVGLALWSAGLRWMMTWRYMTWRWMTWQPDQQPTGRARVLWERLPAARAMFVSTCVVAVALSLSVPGTTRVALAMLWIPLLVAEALGWAIEFRAVRPALRRAPTRNITPQDIAGHADARSGIEEIDAPAMDETDLATGTILQRLVRSRDERNCETVAGTIRVDFVAGQRTASAHVAFCPPLAVVPQCFVEPIGGAAAEVKVAQLLPYGARFEVRLEAVAVQPEEVTLEFVACETSELEGASGEPGTPEAGTDELGQT